MSRSNDKYYSVKDAAALKGKSVSTVKRLITKTKKESLDVYKDTQFFKKEKLKNGSFKLMISEAFLDKHYSVVHLGRSSDPVNEPAKKAINEDVIEILKSQLADEKKEKEHYREKYEESQEQIKQWTNEVLQRASDKVVQLEENVDKPRRGWFRKRRR